MSINALLAAHHAYLRGWGGGQDQDEDLIVYRSGVPHAPLNGVLRTLAQSPAEALATARRRLAGVPRIWWVGPDSTAGVADALVELGATEVAQLPIMAVEIDGACSPSTPPGVFIGAAPDVGEFVRAYGHTSNLSPDAVTVAIERERAFAGDGTVVRLAGRLADGTMVATAVAWISHGITTVYFVGTRPAERRRGIGSAMTRAAIDVGHRAGARTVALTPTPVGESIYRQLGFRVVGHYRLLSF